MLSFKEDTSVESDKAVANQTHKAHQGPPTAVFVESENCSLGEGMFSNKDLLQCDYINAKEEYSKSKLLTRIIIASVL
jgi:hypothetical protein